MEMIPNAEREKIYKERTKRVRAGIFIILPVKVMLVTKHVGDRLFQHLSSTSATNIGQTIRVKTRSLI